METETNFSHITPPIFYGDNYQVWAVKMAVYLEALDLWEAIEEDYDVPLLEILQWLSLRPTKRGRPGSLKLKLAYSLLFQALSLQEL